MCEICSHSQQVKYPKKQINYANPHHSPDPIRLMLGRVRLIHENITHPNNRLSEFRKIHPRIIPTSSPPNHCFGNLQPARGGGKTTFD